MIILGISAFYHDSSAALIVDGKVLYAAQEERFSRIKNDSNFPAETIKFILKESGISPEEIDHIIFYDKPWLKFERILDTILSHSPKSFSQFLSAMPSWLGQKINFRKLLKDELLKINPQFSKFKIKFSEHHFSHACSTYFTSPFQDAAVINIDGVGEWATLSIYEFKNSKYKCLKQMNFPNSIGILYSAFTYFCGFKINSGEYKLMGLSPYGLRDEQTNNYVELIKNNIVKINDDGSIKLNLDFFEFHYGSRTIKSSAWEKLFSLKVRKDEDKIQQSYCNMALAAQIVIEEILLKIVSYTKKISTSNNLCLSGGVALNCVANSKILNSKLFNNLWIHPSPGDAGGAIGSALGLYFEKNNFNGLNKFSPYLGPEFSNLDIERSLKSYKLKYTKVAESELFDNIAQKIFDGSIIGWFQDKMEWGPRALGNRSILASPLDREMQRKLNLKIKFREGFRPFAPVTTEEHSQSYFKNIINNPFMQYTFEVNGFKFQNFNDENLAQRMSKVQSPLPAITHLDGSARLQTVNNDQNKKLHNLLMAFNKISNVPVLINTSFNVRGEPIVCSPTDAIECFLSTDMDYLVMQNYVISKKPNIDIADKFSKREFTLD